MNSLIQSNKIEVKKSSIHGYGVFATDSILKGEILEECHFMSIPVDEYENYNRLTDFVFLYPIDNPTRLAWPFGNGCIYNSSSNPNADWSIDIERKLFIFKSITDINKGEEIFTNYTSHMKNFGKKIR